MSMNADKSLLVTASLDSALKIFDIANFGNFNF